MVSLLENLRSERLLMKILITTLVFYFYKTAFWPLTYLFVVCYFLLVVCLLLRFDWKFDFKNFLRTFFPPLVLVLIMVLSYAFNFSSGTSVLKDFMLLAVLLTLIYFLYLNLFSFGNKIPVAYTVNLILITTTVICIINLLVLSFPQILPVSLAEKLRISDGTTIANDYNFFTLFILFGLIILNYNKSFVEVSFVAESVYLRYALNVLFAVNILFSSSRRGLVVLLAFIMMSIFLRVKDLLKSGSFNKKANKKLWLFVVLSILLVISIYQIVPKQKIVMITYRYATMLGLKDYKTVEKFLWKNDQVVPSKREYLIDKNSFNAKLGYWKASSPSTLMSYTDTPYGTGIELIKSGEPIGFSLHYVGPEILYYAEHTYKISFKIKILRGNMDSFYLGWWADDGGKGYSNTLILQKDIQELGGGWYSCTAEYTFIDNHVGLVGFISTVADNTSFIISDFYLTDEDYNPKLPKYSFEYIGQKDINVWIDEVNSPWKDVNLINNGDFSHGLSFWKSTADALNISVVEIDGVSCALINRGNGNGGDWTLLYDGRNLEFIGNNEYQFSCKVKPIYPEGFPFNIGFWVDEGEGHKISLPKEVTELENGWFEIKVRNTFKNSYGNLIFPINSQQSNSSFYITDIKLLNLSQVQYQSAPVKRVIEKVPEKINQIDIGRATRIEYAVELWKTRYAWYNKVFGHGFHFYDWYLEKFPNTEGRLDYPHNPFITITLYSGIVGLLFFLWLLFKTIMQYYRNRGKYELFFLCFITTLFFSLFSSASPFDPPVMGFFMLLPYLFNVNKNPEPTHNVN